MSDLNVYILMTLLFIQVVKHVSEVQKYIKYCIDYMHSFMRIDNYHNLMIFGE